MKLAIVIKTKHKEKMLKAHTIVNLRFFLRVVRIPLPIPDFQQVLAVLVDVPLLRVKAAVDAARAAGQTELPALQRAEFEAAYTDLLTAGQLANPPSPPSGKRGRTKQTPARNLLDRLATHRDASLAFLTDFHVPFDNNLADRDLRMLKVKGQVSGSFRSADGADQFCRIRGYISTLRNQGYSVLDGLTSGFAGRPHMPRLDAAGPPFSAQARRGLGWSSPIRSQ